MAEGAVIIPFPTRVEVQTCWDCRWHTEISDAKGLSSHCHLFDEAIDYEGVGEDCDGFEEG